MIDEIWLVYGFTHGFDHVISAHKSYEGAVKSRDHEKTIAPTVKIQIRSMRLEA